MPSNPATITDDQLVDLVESLRDEHHGLTGKQLKAFVRLRYGVTVTAGAVMRQAKDLAEQGRLFVGPEVGRDHRDVVYPADYADRYAARIERTCAEPEHRPIPLPPTRETSTYMGVQL